MAFSGSRFSKFREAKGIHSQRALADLTGISQPRICKLEKGKAEPTNAELLTFREKLDCTTDFLLGATYAEAGDDELLGPASEMAFEVFATRTSADSVARCRRVLGHRAAPVTVDGWICLAEMIALAVPPSPRFGVARVQPT